MKTFRNLLEPFGARVFPNDSSFPFTSGGGKVPVSALYDLYDQFTTQRAAGAVNGTQAEPVGGVRTVVDTNSKISVAGGLLDFATGCVNNDGVWYPSSSRALGKTVIVTFAPSATLNFLFGWSAAPPASSLRDSFRFLTNVIYAYQNDAVLPAVAAYSAGTTYSLALVMRSVGVFFFIKGGSFTNWSYLYSSLLGSAASFPCVAIDANSVFTADNIRVPKRLFVPVPLQSDGFSGATTDGAGNPENNGPVGNVWAGTTWTVAAGAVTNTPALGSEMVTNGGFDSDTTGWSASSSILASIVGGQSGNCLSVTNSGAAAGRADQQETTVLGNWYSMSYYHKTGLSQGRISIGTVQGGSDIYNLSGLDDVGFTQYFVSFRALGTAAWLGMRVVSSIAADTTLWDTVTVKPLTLSQLLFSLSHSSANVVLEATITRTAGFQSGVVANLDSAATPANFVIAYLDGNGNCKLDKCVAGVYTNVISAAVTYSAGAVLSLQKDGTSYRLFYNNIAVGSVQTISDAGILSNTLHGLFSTNVGNSFNTYVAWAKGNSENAYPELDLM